MAGSKAMPKMPAMKRARRKACSARAPNSVLAGGTTMPWAATGRPRNQSVAGAPPWKFRHHWRCAASDTITTIASPTS
jgi:hypothetical protein